ncbi:MAG: MarR family transcriptional regulator [Imperialibacter sp.]|uniref:GbsR/MarR family transcriptional regulator n=1 Tax=Imperialibacter sp. TaxID=2038411 RepID=UPI0032EBD63E
MTSETIKLSDKQSELIEKMGVQIEKYGASPAAARVQALLLVSDETALTFDQIMETLKLSKSATSNVINFLLQTNRIEYITKSGDRKRYFRTMMHKWEEQFMEQSQDVKQMSDILSEILRERTGETTEFNSHMKHLVNFLEFYRASVKDAFEKWKQTR